MSTVFIEPRPKGRPEGSAIDDYAVEERSDRVLSTHQTQQAAIDWARAQGHQPLVARVRNTSKDISGHWRSGWPMSNARDEDLIHWLDDWLDLAVSADSSDAGNCAEEALEIRVHLREVHDLSRQRNNLLDYAMVAAHAERAAYLAEAVRVHARLRKAQARAAELTGPDENADLFTASDRVRTQPG
jgi:hypothetical protein